MPAGIGLGKGLAFRQDYGAMTDRAYRRQQYALDVEKQRQDNTQFLADKMKQGHVNTSYGNAKLQQLYEGLNDELANFYLKYGDTFQSDVTAMQEYNKITDQYLNNDVITQEAMVAQEFDRLREAKASGLMDDQEIKEEMNKYLAYANQSADTETSVAPYMFTNPKRRSITEIVTEGRSFLNPIIEDKLRPDGTYWKRTYIPDKQYTDTSLLISYDPANRRSLRETFDNYNDGSWKNIPGMVEYFLRAGDATSLEYKDFNRLLLEQMQNRNARDRAEVEMSQAYFPTVFDQLQNGQTVAADKANAAFSSAGALRTAVPSDTSGKVTIMTLNRWTENDLPSDEESQKKVGQYKTIDVPAGTTTIDAGEMFIDQNGLPKVKMRVQIPITSIFDPSSDGAEVKALRDAGFTETYYNVLGMTESIDQAFEGTSTPRKAVGFVGWIVMPAYFDQSNIDNYEYSRSKSTEHLKDIHSSGQDVNIVKKFPFNAPVVRTILERQTGNDWQKVSEGYADAAKEQNLPMEKMNELPIYYESRDGKIIRWFNAATGEEGSSIDFATGTIIK